MAKTRLLVIFLLAMSTLPVIASASTDVDTTWICSMKSLTYVLGWFMMVVMGIKWIVAESPNERGDAKKGMIYIVIGLMIVSNLCNFFQLYCYAANQGLAGSTKSLDCDVSGLGCPGCQSGSPPTTIPSGGCAAGCSAVGAGGMEHSKWGLCCPGFAPPCESPPQDFMDGTTHTFCCGSGGTTSFDCF